MSFAEVSSLVHHRGGYHPPAVFAAACGYSLCRGRRLLDDPLTLFAEYNAVLRHKYENRPESLGRFGLFFGFVKDFSRFLRVLRYLVAERIERIKDSFGADVLKKSYLNILSVEIAGEVGYAGLAAQIVAGK